MATLNRDLAIRTVENKRRKVVLAKKMTMMKSLVKKRDQKAAPMSSLLARKI